MRPSITLGALFVAAALQSPASAQRGSSVVATPAVEPGTYAESHALLIGVDDYTAGWDDLESIPGELEAVRKALETAGFEVEQVRNPDGDALAAAFKRFIDEHGYNPDSRLLFFFSGHGYSRRDGSRGYLVPADAPDPSVDERGFLRKALPMEQILAWARLMEARHALFLFDSCFSGTIFKARALPAAPASVSKSTALPVRQFITAGSAGETVPARSRFAPSFVRALKGAGDLDGDGFVTGTELGMHLRTQLVDVYRTGQTPQYGKIRDPELDEGDFVFRVGEAGPRVGDPTPEAIAQVEAGVAAEQQGDNDRATELYAQGCDGGSALGCTYLGMMYAMGAGSLLVNEPAAIELYNLGCEGGDHTGCYMLATALQAGGGDDSDADGAVALFQRSCELGGAYWCGPLGTAYREGWGSLEPDLDQAIELYQLACHTGGDAEACYALGSALLDRAVEQGAPDDDPVFEQVLELFANACDNGVALACTHLAGMFIEGSPADAVPLLRVACELDEPNACAVLGGMYVEGTGGLNVDEWTAGQLLVKACNLGLAEACPDP